MVQVISSRTDKTRWVENFLASPNDSVETADVIVATPTICSGHSIDKGVHKVFAFLFLDVLTHEDEVQFLHRVRRHSGKETTEAYIQPVST